MPRKNSQAIEVFLAKTVAHARTMPLPEATFYLRGLLELAGDQPEVAEIRRAFVGLQSCDTQLELLAAAGQLKLSLDGDGSPPSKQKHKP